MLAVCVCCTLNRRPRFPLLRVSLQCVHREGLLSLGLSRSFLPSLGRSVPLRRGICHLSDSSVLSCGIPISGLFHCLADIQCTLRLSVVRWVHSSFCANDRSHFFHSFFLHASTHGLSPCLGRRGVRHDPTLDRLVRLGPARASTISHALLRVIAGYLNGCGSSSNGGSVSRRPSKARLFLSCGKELSTSWRENVGPGGALWSSASALRSAVPAG